MRQAPDDVLSFHEAIRRVHLSSYSPFLSQYRLAHHKGSDTLSRLHDWPCYHTKSLPQFHHPATVDSELGGTLSECSRGDCAGLQRQYSHRWRWYGTFEFHPRVFNRSSVSAPGLALWPTIAWVSVGPTLKTMMQIVCRTSNRVFVGLPLCDFQRSSELLG